MSSVAESGKYGAFFDHHMGQTVRGKLNPTHAPVPDVMRLTEEMSHPSTVSLAPDQKSRVSLRSRLTSNLFVFRQVPSFSAS
jgi:hypothetical protein